MERFSGCFERLWREILGGDSQEIAGLKPVCRDRSWQAAGSCLPIEVRSLPGPQVRGTGGTLIVVWKGLPGPGPPAYPIFYCSSVVRELDPPRKRFMIVEGFLETAKPPNK